MSSSDGIYVNVKQATMLRTARSENVEWRVLPHFAWSISVSRGSKRRRRHLTIGVEDALAEEGVQLAEQQRSLLIVVEARRKESLCSNGKKPLSYV